MIYVVAQIHINAQYTYPKHFKEFGPISFKIIYEILYKTANDVEMTPNKTNKYRLAFKR